ncbi:MAG: HPF/RaiA family ribosome-associated protein, partial [Gemmatimonadetes bacterium]|nr:HPF/RaiA family ribosome-associated protein [Gemmatimonadota bacterium]
MDVPPEVAFRKVEPTDAVKQLIADGIDDLEEVYGRITSCRVMVEETNPGRKAGKLNHVRLDIGVPGSEIVVNRNPPEHPSSQDL